MKARVKATGEIIKVNKITSYGKDFEVLVYYKGENGFSYKEEQLDFEDLTQGKADVKEKSLPKDDTDYWEKLKHQAAIAAMPIAESIVDGLHGSTHHREEGYFCLHTIDMFVDECVGIATALVNKLKEEEK